MQLMNRSYPKAELWDKSITVIEITGTALKLRQDSSTASSSAKAEDRYELGGDGLLR